MVRSNVCEIEKMSLEDAMNKLKALEVFEEVQSFLKSEEVVERIYMGYVRAIILGGKSLEEEAFKKDVHSKLIYRVAEILSSLEPKDRQEVVCKIKSVPNLIFWEEFDKALKIVGNF